LVHAGLAVFLVKTFPPVKMYFLNEVREVHLVSPEVLTFPAAGGFLPGRKEPDVSSPVPEESEPFREGKPLLGRDKSPVPGLGPGSPPASGEPAEHPQILTPVPFRISSSGKTPGFSFSLGGSSWGGEASSHLASGSSRALDLPRPPVSGLSSLRFERIVSRAGGGRRGGKPGDSTGSPLLPEGVDLGQWAKAVVDSIQIQWRVPRIDDSFARPEVKILAVVARDGELLSGEVVKSSGAASFDQAALDALSRSSPLSPLPGEFPMSQIKVYLVFQLGK